MPSIQSNEYRILQLTDFHSDVSEYANELTRNEVRAMVSRHHPDLLAVTGDIWCGDVHPNTAGMWMERDLKFIESLGTPWVFTWGNHDYAEDHPRAQARIEASAHYAADQTTSFGESHIEVCGGAGEPVWDIFVANTTDQWRLPRDLEWVISTSRDLEESRGRVVPAVLFFHIPLRRYQVAIDAGRVAGIANEEVLSWGDEGDIGADLIIGAGNIRACFCGHSHRNDCWFTEGGVIFAYGRCTGHGGYGGDVKRGAKLITLSLVGRELAFETVFGDGSSWSP
jgi:hypothetical protein